MIKTDLSHLQLKETVESYAEKVKSINKMIDEKTGEGNDFLGWANYPYTYDKEEFARIKKDAEYIRNNFDILVVCGIGGSYLGARAAIDALNGIHPTNKVEIIYMGQTFAASYVKQVLDYLKGKKFAINVISKSGTTTETAVAFRLLRELLESQVGKEEAAKAIFATTDKEKGALLELCKKYGYERYVLPDDVGGRYSVFTAVGLLPMAVAGIDDSVHLIAPEVIEPIQHLKVEHLGNHNPRLHTDETLIALSISAVTDPNAERAMEHLAELAGCDAHSTVILSQVDTDVFRKLGVNMSCEPTYQTKKLYHKR